MPGRGQAKYAPSPSRSCVCLSAGQHTGEPPITSRRPAATGTVDSRRRAPGSHPTTRSPVVTCSSQRRPLRRGEFLQRQVGRGRVPSNDDVAWVKCSTPFACTISSTSIAGMWVSASYWGVQGWQITTSGAGSGACFETAPSWYPTRRPLPKSTTSYSPTTSRTGAPEMASRDERLRIIDRD